MLQSSGFGADPPVIMVALNFSVTTESEMKALAQLTNMEDFKQLLKSILIPRTVGSDGHFKVEKVFCL